MTDTPTTEPSWPEAIARFNAEQAAIQADYDAYKAAHPGDDSLLAYYRFRDRRDHAKPVENAYVERILGPTPEPREPGSEG